MPLVAPSRIPAAERARDLAIRLAAQAAPAAEIVAAGQVAHNERPVTREDTIPLQLHINVIAQGPTSRVDGISGVRINPNDTMGQLEWSNPMKRYFDPTQVVKLLAEEHLAPCDWPRSPYVVERLIGLFGTQTVQAAIALRAVDLGAEDMTETQWQTARQAVADRYGQSLGWLYRQARRIDRLVRGQYGLRPPSQQQARGQWTERNTRRLRREGVAV